MLRSNVAYDHQRQNRGGELIKSEQSDGNNLQKLLQS